MGFLENLKTVHSWAKAAEESGPKWARILAVGRRIGPVMKIDLEIHWGDEPPLAFSRYQVVPRGVRPEVGQDVAITRDSGVEATAYGIDWKKPPHYGAPYRGAISEADRARLPRRPETSGPG